MKGNLRLFLETSDTKREEVNSILEQTATLTSSDYLEYTLNVKEWNGSISMTLSLNQDMTLEKVKSLLSSIAEIIANG